MWVTGEETRVCTHIVAIGVDGLCVEAVFALAFALLDVLADPYIPVEPENEVNTTWERGEMRLEPADERRRHGHELAIPQLTQNQTGKQIIFLHTQREGQGTRLAVLKGAGVQGHRTVREEGLHLGYEKVALFEERPHLELVAFEFTTLDTIGSLFGRR